MGQSLGEMAVGSFPMIFQLSGLNVNQANTDIGTFTGLPPRYIVRKLYFNNASAAPTLATVDLRTAAAGAGSAIVSAQVLSTLSSAGVVLDSTLALTTAQTAPSLVVRAVAAAGGAATVDAALEIIPLSS